MHILVLTAAVANDLRKTYGMNSQILKYIRGNKCDRILLCGSCCCDYSSQFENIPIEKITVAKLFRTLKNITKEYKNLCTITIAHFNEQKIIENYLRNNDRLHVCFINLDKCTDKYANYAYTDIALDPNYFSVKFREYNGKSSVIFNIYELPFVKI
jgi:hypothetical protein